MIKLTLAVNATRDMELMAILKREAIHQTKATAKPLAEVIEAAETYETAKIRKDALAAIADLKQKGSSDQAQRLVLGPGRNDGAGAGLRRSERDGAGPARPALHRRRRHRDRRTEGVHAREVAPRTT